MTTEKIKAKTCPFCGGTPIWKMALGHWFECEQCGIETDVYSTLHDALAAWNKRAESTEWVVLE